MEDHMTIPSHDWHRLHRYGMRKLERDANRFRFDDAAFWRCAFMIVATALVCLAWCVVW